MTSSILTDMLSEVSLDNPYMDEFREDVILNSPVHKTVFNPSNLRVSTITALSDIGITFNNDILYENYDMEYYRIQLDNHVKGILNKEDYPLITLIQRTSNIYKGIPVKKKKRERGR